MFLYTLQKTILSCCDWWPVARWRGIGGGALNLNFLKYFLQVFLSD